MTSASADRIGEDYFNRMTPGIVSSQGDRGSSQAGESGQRGGYEASGPCGDSWSAAATGIRRNDPLYLYFVDKNAHFYPLYGQDRSIYGAEWPLLLIIEFRGKIQPLVNISQRDSGIQLPQLALIFLSVPKLVHQGRVATPHPRSPRYFGIIAP